MPTEPDKRQQRVADVPTPELSDARSRMRSVVHQLMSVGAITPFHDINPTDSVELGMAKLDYNALALRALPVLRRFFDQARRMFGDLNMEFQTRLIAEAERYEATLATAQARTAEIQRQAQGHPEYAQAATQAQEFVTRLTGLASLDNPEGVYLCEGLALLAEKRAREQRESTRREETPEGPAREEASEQGRYLFAIAVIVEELAGNTETVANWDNMVADLAPADIDDSFERAVALRSKLLNLLEEAVQHVAEGSATKQERVLVERIQMQIGTQLLQDFIDGPYAGWFNEKMGNLQEEGPAAHFVEGLLEEEELLEEVEENALGAGDTALAVSASEARAAVDVVLSEMVDPAGLEADSSEERAIESTQALVAQAIQTMQREVQFLFTGNRIGVGNIKSAEVRQYITEERVIDAFDAQLLDISRVEKPMGARDIATLLTLAGNPPVRDARLLALIDEAVVTRQVHIILNEIQAVVDFSNDGRHPEGIRLSIADVKRIISGLPEDAICRKISHKGNGYNARFRLEDVVMYMCDSRKGRDAELSSTTKARVHLAFEAEMRNRLGQGARRA